MTDGPDPHASLGSPEGRAARPRRSRRVVPWLVLGFLAAIALLYGGAYAYAGDRLPHDTTIEGVEVGGLRPKAAERLLDRALVDLSSEPVPVTAAGREDTVDPEEVGLRVDVAASVDQVPVGRSWNPTHLWRVVSGGEQHAAVVTVDEARLTERLTDVAEQVDRPVREGAVRIRPDGPVPTYPRDGRALDVDAAGAAVLTAFPSPEGTVALEVETLQPDLTEAEVDRAVREFGEPAVSAPVTLEAGDGQATVEPAEFAPLLSMRARGSRLVPAVDSAGLVRAAEARLAGALPEPRNATVALVDGRPQVVPGQNGTTIDEERLAERFLTAVVADGTDRAVQLPTEAQAPAVTTGEVRSWGVREVVSEFTTYYPHADYRNVNIGRAAELIDGTVVAPGELFSFNETVGERTAENGFTRGFVISNGIFAEDYGGGVSQMATTTFNAAFFAGLEDVEHKPHSFYIDRYPVGREATVAWPTVDLRFRNDTDFGVLIETRHTPSTLSTSGAIMVRLWSTKVWEIEALTSDRYDFTAPDTRVLTGEDCFPNTGYSGFDVDVTRVFRRVGEEQVHHRELMHTTYTPSDTVLCRR